MLQNFIHWQKKNKCYAKKINKSTKKDLDRKTFLYITTFLLSNKVRKSVNDILEKNGINENASENGVISALYYKNQIFLDKMLSIKKAV